MRHLLPVLAVVSLVGASNSDEIRRLASPICGNGHCETEETCDTCPEDCDCTQSRDLYYSYTYKTCSHNGQICTSASDCNRIGNCYGGELCDSDDDCPPILYYGYQYPGRCYLSNENTCDPTSPPPSFTFLGVADTPYNDYEECMARQEGLRIDKNAEHKFFFHLGDIRNGQAHADGSYTSYCDKKLFENIADVWKDVPYPTFFTPGDNGWLDCPEPYGYTPDGWLPAPERAYKLWEEYLFYYYEQGTNTLPAGSQVLRGTSEDANGLGFVPARHEARLSEDRPELFSFFLQENKALVVGTSTPGKGRENSKWNTPLGMKYLEKDNRRWINYNFHKYLPSVVIILAHSIEPDHNSGVGDFLERLANKYPAVPFLVLMDEHCFTDLQLFSSVPNIYKLRLDDTSTPIEISVDLSKYYPSNMAKVFNRDQGCYCHTDHKPTRKICWDKYSVSSECWNKCASMEAVCGGLDIGPFYGPGMPWCGCPDGAECCSYGENTCSWRNSCSF